MAEALRREEVKRFAQGKGLIEQTPFQKTPLPVGEPPSLYAASSFRVSGDQPPQECLYGGFDAGSKLCVE
jgi:hypothetical protein